MRALAGLPLAARTGPSTSGTRVNLYARRQRRPGVAGVCTHLVQKVYLREVYSRQPVGLLLRDTLYHARSDGSSNPPSMARADAAVLCTI